MTEENNSTLPPPQEPQAPVAPKISDLGARVKTAVPLAAAIILILAFGSSTIVGVVGLFFAIVGIMEFQKFFPGLDSWQAKLILYGGTVLIGLGAILGDVQGLSAMVMVCFVIVLFYTLLFNPIEKMTDLHEQGVLLLGLLWISWSISHIVLIKELPQGTRLLFFLMFVIWVNDTAAYFGGKKFGKTPLAPTISPKKTIEGSLCGLAAGGLIGTLYSLVFLKYVIWWQALVMALLMCVLGGMGDLVESKLKRMANVKDSGTIFPGHGGVLDRIDALFTTVPIFFYINYFIYYFSHG